ncbi:hypothetical protein BGV40_10140 [Methanosarcina sp. Ant1]|nr:hypothetical protein BGV40_10140 [Methanosarcina sp. Ant1]
MKASMKTQEKQPELRLGSTRSVSLASLPEFRFGITENRVFSGSCTASATARGPFRFAQEDEFRKL